MACIITGKTAVKVTTWNVRSETLSDNSDVYNVVNAFTGETIHARSLDAAIRIHAVLNADSIH